MAQLEATEIWRQIPPEEKIRLMAQAQSEGILAASILIMVASTMAIGLQMTWLMWGAIACAPLVFQFSAGRAWRGIRPRLMLEYLAARSAARRYAYTAAAKELNLSLLFRGHLERGFEAAEGQDALEASIADNKESEIWIALFADAVVLMTEKPGGAKLEFAHLIDDKLTVRAENLDDRGDYTSRKEIILESSDRRSSAKGAIKITSPYPAAMVVFQKQLEASLVQARLRAEKEKGLASGEELDYDAEV